MSWRKWGGAICIWFALLALSNDLRAEQKIFANVNGESLSQAEFETAVSIAMRQRFYHGRMDDQRAVMLRHEVAGQLIDELLLMQEAQRRKIVVDDDTVEREVERELAQFKVADLSAGQRDHLLGMLRQQVSSRLLLDALRLQEEELVVPEPAAVKAYYNTNVDKFTTPEQQHLAVILLKVAPSSSVAVWQAAKDEAAKLKQRLEKGADFGELANLHSGDASAEFGGDLGFVHKGMLAQDAQVVVNKLKAGEVSEPVAILQGVALFKLKGIKEVVVNPFDKVKVRAGGLLRRQMIEQGWASLLESLRKKTTIEIFDNEIIMANMWVNKLVVDGR
ncbi:peptidylprolyl isomerase [Pseudomonadota bacterium]